jgi:hypothetical protein
VFFMVPRFTQQVHIDGFSSDSLKANDSVGNRFMGMPSCSPIVFGDAIRFIGNAAQTSILQIPAHAEFERSIWKASHKD